MAGTKRRTKKPSRDSKKGGAKRKAKRRTPAPKRSTRLRPPKKRAGEKLDARLAFLAATADKETPKDLASAVKAARRRRRPGRRPSAPVEPLRPKSVTALPFSVQSAAAQTSEFKRDELLEDDLVQVLIELADGDGETLDGAAEKLSERIAEWSGSAHRVSRSTFSASVPRTELAKLARMSEVGFVEANAVLRPRLNQAHVAANLQDSDRNWTVTQMGEGVLIGVVDTGIDVTHEAFGRGEDTRIVDYLDQTTGRRYNEAALRKGRGTRAPDTDGHGTHVAGIAAGNGAGSEDWIYEGVAPAAKLAIVKTTFDTRSIAEAVSHIFDVADARNEPCVINLSLGGHYGAHDGSSVLERTIDELSGPGRMVVVSAGNEGDAAIHAGADLEPDTERWTARFELHPRTLNEIEVGLGVLHVWTQREDALDIRLRSPNGELFKAPTSGVREVDRSHFAVKCKQQVAGYSGDLCTTFEVVTVPQSNWLRGWSIIVKPAKKKGIKAGSVHAWIIDEDMGRFTRGWTHSHLVGMPGTAFSAITVASYASRSGWESEDPEFPTVELEAANLEEISYFSSPGPTRDGHNKPEIAAPGQWLISALSSNASHEDMPPWRRVPGGKYASLQGTSMAAPYVTGAIALLLEKNPTLDWAEVKRRLMKSARHDEHTASTWDRRWGYGKLDVERLLTVEPK